MKIAEWHELNVFRNCERALALAIRDNPADTSLRLKLADFLVEDHQFVRADFVRVAGLPSAKAIEWTRYHRHLTGGWCKEDLRILLPNTRYGGLGHVPVRLCDARSDFLTSPDFYSLTGSGVVLGISHGSIEQIYCSVQHWRNYGAGLVSLEPVRFVRLAGKREDRFWCGSVGGYDYSATGSGCVPRWLLDEMPGNPHKLGGRTRYVKVFADVPEALAALSTGAITWAKKKAGMIANESVPDLTLAA